MYNDFMNIPLPPCPCPVCGQIHPHFVSGSPLSAHGAGRATQCVPHSRFRMHMTPEEEESMIYGPMFQRMFPGTPCRVVSAHPGAHPVTNGVQAGQAARTPAYGMGSVTMKKKTLPIVIAIGALAFLGLIFSGRG